MIIKNKTKLHFLLGGILFVTFAIASCNSDDSDKKADEPAKTETKTDPPPAPDGADTTKMDEGDTRPTPTPNEP